MDNLEAILWAVVGALTLVGEVLTVSFFLLFFTLGAVVGLALALLGFGLTLQITGFIAVSVLSMLVLRPALLDRLAVQSGERYEGHKGIAGKSATVREAIEAGESGVVQLEGGEYWTARSALPKRRIQKGEKVRVLDTDGITALVDTLDNTEGPENETEV